MAKEKTNTLKRLFHIHDWQKWSKPTERTYQTYDVPPALVFNGEGIGLKTYRSLIQDRTCKSCGKYVWRKV